MKGPTSASYGPPPSSFTESTLASVARRKRRTTLIITVVLALTATLFVGGWALWRVADAADPERVSAAQPPPDAVRETLEKVPKTPEGQFAVEWSEELKPNRRASTKGLWATADIAAKSFANAVRGYEIGTAKKKWEVEFAGPLCAVTRHISVDGRTAFAVPGKRPEKKQEATTPCDHLAVVDLDTGRKLWEKPLPDESADSMSVNVTMTRGTAVVSWGQGAAAYDMKSGKRLWADLTPSTCTDIGFAGGADLIALQSCEDSGDLLFRIQKAAPRTGKAMGPTRSRGESGASTCSLRHHPSSRSPRVTTARSTT